MTQAESFAIHRVHELSEQTYATFREFVAQVERYDGSSPFSDQAMLAAQSGKRATFVISFTDAARDVHAAGAKPQNSPGEADFLLNTQAVVDGRAAWCAVGIVGEGELDVAVLPTMRNKGLGGALFARLLSACSGELRAWVHGIQPAADHLLISAGFQPVRSLLRLVLDPANLPEAIRLAKVMPPHVQVKTFDRNYVTQAQHWVRVNAAAFASHPEQGRLGLDDFLATTHESWFDPEDLLLAYDKHEQNLLGFSWVKTLRQPQQGGFSLGFKEAGSSTVPALQQGSDPLNKVDHEAEAGGGLDPQVEPQLQVETELYALGVDPLAHGTGLGAALLGASLQRMAVHRPNRITLYVDGDNEPALSIYTRAGFLIETRSTQWLRGGAADTMGV